MTVCEWFWILKATMAYQRFNPQNFLLGLIKFVCGVAIALFVICLAEWLWVLSVWPDLERTDWLFLCALLVLVRQHVLTLFVLIAKVFSQYIQIKVHLFFELVFVWLVGWVLLLLCLARVAELRLVCLELVVLLPKLWHSLVHLSWLLRDLMWGVRIHRLGYKNINRYNYSLH